MEKSDTIPLKAQSPGHGLSRKRIICMAIVFAAGMLRILNFIKKNLWIFHFFSLHWMGFITLPSASILSQ